MEQTKKPLRIPNRDKQGRFAPPPAFNSDDIAKAIAEFEAKQKEQQK